MVQHYIKYKVPPGGIEQGQIFTVPIVVSHQVTNTQVSQQQQQQQQHQFAKIQQQQSSQSTAIVDSNCCTNLII